MTTNTDEVQSDLAAINLDTDSRFVEVIIDQDIRLSLNKEIDPSTLDKHEAPNGPDFLLKDVNIARKKLDVAVREENFAESNLLYFKQKEAGTLDPQGLKRSFIWVTL